MNFFGVSERPCVGCRKITKYVCGLCKNPVCGISYPNNDEDPNSETNRCFWGHEYQCEHPDYSGKPDNESTMFLVCVVVMAGIATLLTCYTN